jgi:ClpP class serine protease
LEQAKADLEEILRQLREEETSRTLAMLEGRFRKMLDAQVEVYEGTKRLDKVPPAQRDRDDEIEAGRLSRKESQIAGEADKALAVLREEGTAVAFPEAVTEMRDDMQQVVDRLAQAKVGEVTQGIEKDIIVALEEMIASLQKAQKDKDSKPTPGQPAPDEDSDPPLVDTLSELKMIRALQMRVNLRTQRYAEMTKTEQTETPELLEALKRLAEREQRIHQVTRDIAVGRNQ